MVDTNEGKTAILTSRFFPPPAQADLSDINAPTPAASPLQISRDVSTQEVLDELARLPNKKAPGPDKIPNEALKACREEISPTIAELARAYFNIGYFPSAFRETTTIVLRKKGKKDYSLPGSYRPIALENTLAKVIEGLIASRITKAFEENSLLPRTQMGARSGRATTTALSLLTTTVHSVWQKHPGYVASMLSLDLSGAFDKVSHERLLARLRSKGSPEWLCNTISSFLIGRQTQVSFDGYISAPISVHTGIP
jgi:hypothetical protein